MSERALPIGGDIELCDRHRLAQFYNVSEETLRRWERDGKIPRGYRIGSTVRFHLAEHRRHVLGQRAAGPNATALSRLSSVCKFRILELVPLQAKENRRRPWTAISNRAAR